MTGTIRFREKTFITVLLIISFLVFVTAKGIAQQLASKMKLVENIYGSNSLLVNGTQFFEPHPNANNHPYFSSEEWQKAILFIAGERYEVTQLKYNTSIDALLLNFADKKGGIMPLLLYSTWIDSFYLAQNKFIKSDAYETDLLNQKYFEVIYEGKQKILAQHIKFFKKQYNDYNPYGLYSNDRKLLFLELNNEIFPVKNKHQFLRYFPNQKRTIKKFLRKNDIKYKQASPADWLLLMNYLNTI